jgi:drug/metabolite transporter (DMT)-like permease
MFNLINARAASKGDDPTVGMLDTPLYFGIMIGIGLVQVALVQFAGHFFSCTPLNGKDWAVTIALGALTLPVGFIIRRLPGEGGEARYGPVREDNERLLN